MPRISAIVGLLVLLVAGGAEACDCADLSLPRRVAAADLVLVARVSSYRQLEYVTVSPIEVFKGSATKALRIQTGTTDCDFFLPPVDPKIGEKYLLYLQQSKGRVTASRCLASGRMREKETELRALRKPQAGK